MNGGSEGGRISGEKEEVAKVEKVYRRIKDVCRAYIYPPAQCCVLLSTGTSLVL